MGLIPMTLLSHRKYLGQGQVPGLQEKDWIKRHGTLKDLGNTLVTGWIQWKPGKDWELDCLFWKSTWSQAWHKYSHPNKEAFSLSCTVTRSGLFFGTFSLHNNRVALAATCYPAVMQTKHRPGHSTSQEQTTLAQMRLDMNSALAWHRNVECWPFSWAWWRQDGTCSSVGRMEMRPWEPEASLLFSPKINLTMPQPPMCGSLECFPGGAVNFTGKTFIQHL